MARHVIPERLREKDVSSGNELLGGGFGYPVRLTEGGTVQLVEGQSHLKSGVYHFAMYNYMDLVGSPNFGGNVPSLLFGVFTGDVLRYHEDVMRMGLDTWEPRVENTRVTVGKSTDTSTDEKATMIIQYSIKVVGDEDYLKVPLEKRGE